MLCFQSFKKKAYRPYCLQKTLDTIYLNIFKDTAFVKGISLISMRLFSNIRIDLEYIRIY